MDRWSLDRKVLRDLGGPARVRTEFERGRPNRWPLRFGRGFLASPFHCRSTRMALATRAGMDWARGLGVGGRQHRERSLLRWRQIRSCAEPLEANQPRGRACRLFAAYKCLDGP